MAIAIYMYIVLHTIKVSFQKFHVPLKLICFNTYSSKVTQTVCTLVKRSLYTIAYMLSAAHAAILRETYQRIKKSEYYRILELTEQIQDVKYRAVYCVVYSSVHSLGRCIATLKSFCTIRSIMAQLQ